MTDIHTDKAFSSEENWGSGTFRFDQRVAQVFDDMVGRSVPGYETIQLLVADLALRTAHHGPIYDFGCSTGTTIKCIAQRAGDRALNLVGYDQSEEMLEQCAEKLTNLPRQHDLSLYAKNIVDDELFEHGPAGSVILCLVLQFVRPNQRTELIKKIYDGLAPGGSLLLVEKTVNSDVKTNQLFIDYYHSYKAEMGYSELEISRKREALENVLIPYTRAENLDLFKTAGFKVNESFFQWMNFSGFIAIKDQ